MNQPENNDPLDALLQEQNAYLDDNGFTARVMKSLPRRRHAWLRPFILLLAGTTGLALAIYWRPFGDLPPLDSDLLLSLNGNALTAWLVPAVVVASIALAVFEAVQIERD